MNTFFSLFFVISLVGSIASIVSIRRRNKNRIDSRRIQSVLLVFIIAAVFSFIGIGATADVENNLEGRITSTLSDTQSIDATEVISESGVQSTGDITDELETIATPVATADLTDETTNLEATSTSLIPAASEELIVHFIDVGQGDAILIVQGDFAMLIDAGDNNKGTMVVDYIRKQGISRLDYVIGTHPHADHIGGLSDVINDLEIGRIILPDIAHTTKTFEDMLLAIQDKGMRITKANHGESYNLGNSRIEILGPISIKSNDLNNASVVCKLTYGSTSFLFTGDIEQEAEAEILRNDYNLSADVIKISHHGSGTSSLPAFLSAVNPDHAIIMCGVNNRYNHPAKQTLDNLAAMNINVYRTDLAGTIIAKSDGENISFNVNPKLGTAGGSTSPPTTTSKTETTTKESTTTTTTTAKETSAVTTKSETAVTGSIELVSITKPFVPGSKATVKIKGMPNTQYNIVVNYKSGPSSAAGLDPKTSDSSGYVSWTWNVGSRTSSGDYHLEITGGGQTLKVNFTVQ